MASWLVRSTPDRNNSQTFPRGSRARFPHGGHQLSPLVCDGTQKVTFRDVLHEDDDRTKTSVILNLKNSYDNSGLTSHAI